MSEETTLEVQELEKQEVETEAERTRDCACFVPRADIYETGDEIVVLVDMPGVDENSVEVTLEESVLTIKGIVEPVAPAGLALAHAEYRVGDFERSFTLGDRIDRDGIEATVKNGVLEMILPKSTESKLRKISVTG
jgi:HSP20 family molecular chaperone IbpA